MIFRISSYKHHPTTAARNTLICIFPEGYVAKGQVLESKVSNGELDCWQARYHHLLPVWQSADLPWAKVSLRVCICICISLSGMKPTCRMNMEQFSTLISWCRSPSISRTTTVCPSSQVLIYCMHIDLYLYFHLYLYYPGADATPPRSTRDDQEDSPSLKLEASCQTTDALCVRCS